MLWIKDLHKSYKTKQGEEHHALKGINLSLEENGFLFLLGKSGSGKSTLLNILGGLDTYDQGEIIIKDRHTKQFKTHDWDSFRNTYIGFVFQEFYMVDSFTIGKNISISLELQGYPKKEIKDRVNEILKQVGLEGYANRKTSEISGGQKQRIAIARALIKDPQIILADEPTGNLDSETGKAILDILQELSKEKLVIMVTHDTEFARTYADRIIELKDGIIINDGLSNDQNQHYIYENVDENDLSFIHFPKGKHLNQQLIQYITQQSEQNKYSYIILTTEPNQVTSASINLKSNEESESNDFTTRVNQSNSTLELKDSKLPSKNAIKLAFSNIFMKKFRFLFINVLFIISLVLLGFATMFSFFDFPASSSSTMINNELDYIGFKKEPTVFCINDNDCIDIPNRISEEEFTDLKETYPSMNFTMSNQINTYFTNNNRDEMGYFTNKMEYVTIINDKEMFPLYRGRYPKEVGEVLISDYIARVMRVFAYGRINITDLLGRSIQSGEDRYTIVGIVDTDSEKFDHLVNSRIMERFEEANFFETVNAHYKHLYMTQETFDFTFNRIQTSAKIDDQSFNLKLVHTDESLSSELIGGSRLPIVNNEIVIPASEAYHIFLNKQLSDFDPIDADLLSLIGQNIDLTIQVRDLSNYETGSGDPNIIDLTTRNYKIVGIYHDIIRGEVNHNSKWIGTKEEIESIDTLMQPYMGDFNPTSNMTYIHLSDDQEENEAFIQSLVRDGYIHVTEYSTALYQLNDLINQFESVLYIVGSIIASFTILMIFLFITASIHKKQKEIGILRAIGARGIDVSKIYLFEGMIIAIISSLWANGIIIGLVYLANYYLTMEMHFDLVILNYGVFNILLVFGFAMLVIILATFLPIKRITVMKPIHAIKRI